MSARAAVRRTNAGSSHTSAGRTRPMTIASARPSSGMPSNIDSVRAGHNSAIATAAFHAMTDAPAAMREAWAAGTIRARDAKVVTLLDADRLDRRRYADSRTARRHAPEHRRSRHSGDDAFRSAAVPRVRDAAR